MVCEIFFGFLLLTQYFPLAEQSVTNSFDARTFCSSRRYEYIVPTAAFRPRQQLPKEIIAAYIRRYLMDRKKREAAAAAAADAAVGTSVQMLFRFFC